MKQELYTILKTPNGQPYVPGSSLKGAIKTALLYDWLTKQRAGQEWLRAFIQNLNSKERRRESEKQLEQQLNRYQFQVTDSKPFAGEVIRVLGTARLHLNDANSNGIPQRWETVSQNHTTQLTLTFHHPPDTERLTWEGVAKCISNFSYNANLHELDLLPTHDDYTDAYEFLQEQYERMEDDPEGVYLRLGAAKGYFHNSVGLAIHDADSSDEKTMFKAFLKQQFPKVKEPKPKHFPATRPLVAGTYEPLGWVKLEII